MINHIFALHHFTTENNILGKINGRSTECPILESRNIQFQGIFDTIICSQALRCRQTLDAFLSDKQSPKIIYTSEVLERNMGTLEGKIRLEMQIKYPELFVNGTFDVFATPPQGESFNQFYKRVTMFWEKYYNSLDGTILICSHNQFLKMLSFVVLGKKNYQ